jgi:hypothetical protein
VRPELGSALRRLLPGRSRRERDRGREGPAGPAEIASEYSTPELEEFLRGDLVPGQADPAFRERLRGELWELVQRLYARSRPGDPRAD